MSKKYLLALIFLSKSFLTFSQNDSAICETLEKKVDDFSNKITISTPLLNGSEVLRLGMVKTILKGKITYYLSLTCSGITPVVGAKGVFVIFSDGTKWSRPNKVDVSASERGYEYFAFVALTPADVAIFSNKVIRKYKLDIFDRECSSNEAENFRDQSICLKTAK